MNIGNKRNMPLLLHPKKKRTGRHFHQLLRQKEPLAVHPPPSKRREAKRKGDLQVPVLREKKGNVSHRRGNIISIQDPYYYYYYFYYIEARGGLYIHKSNRRGNRFLSSIERPLASSILIDDIHST